MMVLPPIQAEKPPNKLSPSALQMLNAPADVKVSVTNEFRELIVVKSYCAFDDRWRGKAFWSQDHADSQSVFAFPPSLPKQFKD
jgi:hypothetical protein